MRQEWRVEDFDHEEPRPPQRPRYQTRSQSGSAHPGPQVSERSLAAGSGPMVVQERSDFDLEEGGFYGSRKPKLLGEP